MITTNFFRSTIILLVLFFTIISIPDLKAQEIESQKVEVAATGSELTINNVLGKLAETKADKALEESTKAEIIEFYESILRQLRSAESFEAKTKYYRESVQNAVREIQKVHEKTDKVVANAKKYSASENKKLSRKKLENQLYESQTRLESLKNNLEKLDRDVKRQQSRSSQARSDQQLVRDKIHELERLQDIPPTSTTGTYKVQRSAHVANERALNAELNSLEMEISTLPQRLKLLRARFDLAIAEVAAQSMKVESLEQLTVERRESEASRDSRELTEALQAASNKHPRIRAVIQRNFELGREIHEISENIKGATARRDELALINKQVTEESENSAKKIPLAGLSPTLAGILREQRRHLPNNAEIDQKVENLLNSTGELTLRKFEIEEELKKFSDIEQVAKKNLVTDVHDRFSKHELKRFQVELQLLIAKQNSLLEKLNNTYSTYLNLLGDIDFSRQELSKVVTRYAAFLDENLLWVRSSKPINQQFFWDLFKSVAWLVKPENWLGTLSALSAAIYSHKILVVLATLAIVGVLLARHRIKVRLTEISELVDSSRTDRFEYTLDLIVLTICLTAPSAATLYVIGWLLMSNINGTEFSAAVGVGFCSASLPLFVLQTFYHFFTSNGLAGLHLKWSKKTIALFHSQISWFRCIAIPCAFGINLTASQSLNEYGDSLGRLLMILLMVSISWCLNKILHPVRGTLSSYLAKHSGTFLSKTAYLWYLLVVLVPLIIASFSAAGYIVSALELQQKLIATIRLIFIAIFVHQISLRGLRLFARELALKKLRDKRHATKESIAVGEAGESIPTIDPDEMDVSTINTQSMRVLQIVILFATIVGIWLLWEDVLPALAILNEWVFWHKSVVVDGVTTVQPVSLSNLLLAVLYILVGVTAIRNLPGVMEVLILNHFSVETGSRYAINQLVSYFLIAGTTILVATELGGQWSQLQWLVAALGVGLGFGLQEIFANFVSGIILLFERPIRIGDTVTIGDVSGTVSRIQIRATTITDWERKDLVVPNKSFITDQIVNWTRSDNITRILIPIGVAYGSDTKLVHRIISETVESHPLVLSEPEPTVFFIGFGDSSLDFEIRLYVKLVSNRLPVTHELHMEIDRSLNEHGIEIPFPQRDIHVKTQTQSATNPPDQNT